MLGSVEDVVSSGWWKDGTRCPRRWQGRVHEGTVGAVDHESLSAERFVAVHCRVDVENCC